MPIFHVVIVLLGIGVSWASTDTPRSVFDLLNRVPDPPSTAKDALRWFDKGGRLGHSVVLPLKEEMTRYRKDSELLSQATSKDSGRSALILGLDHVGIDAARLQIDPVYSTQMQENLRRMTVQEKLTLAQKILEPQVVAQPPSTKNQRNESQAVQAALVAAEAFSQRRKAWRAGKRMELINHFGEIPHAVPQKKLKRSPPATKWDLAECHADCVTEWKAYGKDLWSLILERETEILRKRREVLQEYKTFLAQEFMKEADKHLVATLYGTLAIKSDNREALARYHQGLLEEIMGLVDLTETAARQAAEVVHGGVEKFYGK